MSDTEDEYSLEDYWSHTNPTPFPSSIPKSELTAIWRCIHCRYYWYEDIRTIVKRINPCPRCRGLHRQPYIAEDHTNEEKSCKSNLPTRKNFARRYPEIARMWSPKNRLPPERYSSLSHHLVRWQCPRCKYHWKRVIREQVLIGSICVICRK